MPLPIESFEPSVPARQQETPLSSHVDAIFSNRWLIIAITLIALLGAVAYVMVTPSVYSADIIVQVEEELPQGQSRSLLGDVSAIFDTKAETSGEMEVLRSRMVVGPAVDKFMLYIHAKPRYFPVVGEWLAQRHESLPYPSGLPRGGYAWGGESISISQLDVPNEWLGKPFRITNLGEGAYTLNDKLTGATFNGTVGKPEHFLLPGGGALDVHVDALNGRPGTEYTVSRTSRLAAIEDVQSRLGIFERGRTSGVIGVTLEGNDPVLTTAVLNQIGQEYVQQNVNRKSAQAEKSLAFLDQQLPQLKRELDAAETKYNSLRNKRGTIDLSEEAKLILAQSVDAQTKVMELRAKRQELITRFAPTHPSIVAIDRQIASLTGDVNRIGDNIKQLPDLEQDVVRLVRDVRVNTELYTGLLNNAQQLRLIRAGKVGNVRILDAAVQPDKPVRPKAAIIIAVVTAIGLIIGVLCAFVRNALFGGLSEPDDVERYTGLPVLAAIPHSDLQDKLWRRSRRKNATVPALLAQSQGNAPPIESLRSFRNVLQASLRQSANNMVMFTGPVAGVGKSFLSANFAFIQGGVGKRVLLIDADFRKGQLNRYFGVPKEDGLFEVLSGTLPLERVRKHSVSEGVDFISTGAVSFDPSELLASPIFGQTLRELASQYDMVILDTAPVLSSPDAAVVGTHAAAVMVVVRSGMNTVGEIRETAKRLIQAGAPVDGVLFNGLKLMTERFGFRSKYGGYRYSRAAYYGDFKQNGPK